MSAIGSNLSMAARRIEPNLIVFHAKLDAQELII